MSTSTLRAPPRRRRKRVVAEENAHRDDNDENKHPQFMNMHSRTSSIADDEHDGFLSKEMEEEGIPGKASRYIPPPPPPSHVKSRFLRSMSISPLCEKLIKKYPSLTDNILRISCSQQAASSRTMSHSIPSVLRENVSKIISISRNIIKDASQSKSRTATIIDAYYIVTHLLRAVVGATPKGSSKSEAVIKLLYHCITKVSELGCSKETERSADDANSTNEMMLVICFVSWDTLCTALESYRVPMGGDGMVSFRRDAFDAAIPYITASNKDADANAIQATMNFRQSITLVIKSTIAMTLCLKRAIIVNTEWPAQEISDFGLSTSKLGSCTDFMIQIFHRTIEPTISFVIQHRNLDSSEAICDVKSHSKLSFCTLWDLSSKLKNRADVSPETLLRIRRCSLLMNLPECKDDNTSSEVFGTKFIASICTYARKAAASYLQHQEHAARPSQISRKGSPLWSFYESLTERFVCLERFEAAIPIEYMEFAVTRSVHTRSWLDVGEHDEDMTDTSRAALTFCKYALAIRFALESDEPVSDTSMLQFCNDVMQMFQGVITQRELRAEELEQYMRLFNSIQLSRAVGIFTKQSAPADDLKVPMELQIASALLTNCLCPFIVEQIVPMYSDDNDVQDATTTTTATATDNSNSRESEEHGRLKQKEEHHAILVDCYAKSIFALDCLAAKLNDSRYEAMADQTALNLVESLSDDMSRPLLERAAKTIAIIARQRTERSSFSGAASAHLIALRQFHDIQVASDGFVTSDLQLVNRWAHLSSVYQSAQRLDEAMLSLSVTLRLSIEEAADGAQLDQARDAIPLNVFKVLLSKTVPFVPSEDIADGRTVSTQLSLSKRFVKLGVKRILGGCLEISSNITSNNNNAIDHDKVIEMLYESQDSDFEMVWTENAHGSLSIESLFGAIVMTDTCTLSTAYDQVVMLTEMLSTLSMMLQYQIEHDDSKILETLLSSFLELVVMAAERIHFLIGEFCDGFSRAHIVALYAMASTVLIRVGRFHDSTSINQMKLSLQDRLQMNDVDAAIQQLNGGTQRSLLCASMAYARYSNAQMDSSTEDPIADVEASQIIALCRDVLDSAVAATGPATSMGNSEDGDGTETAIKLSIWTLTKLHSILPDHHGFLGQRLQSASMLVEFAGRLDDSDLADWHKWIALTSCLNEDIALSPSKSVTGNATCLEELIQTLSPFHTDTLVISPAIGAIMSQVAWMLRSSASSHDMQELNHILSALDSTLMDVTNSSVDSTSPMMTVLTMWTRSSVLLVRATAALRGWNPRHAVQLVEESRRLSQSTRSVMRQAVSANSSQAPFWLQCFAEVLPRLLKRHQMVCYHIVSGLWCFAGDYRMSQSYAKGVMAILEQQRATTVSASASALPNEAADASLDTGASFVQQGAIENSILLIQSTSKNLDGLIADAATVEEKQCSLPSPGDPHASINHVLQCDYVMKMGDMLYGESSAPKSSPFGTFYSKAHTLLNSISDTDVQHDFLAKYDVDRITMHLQLRRIRYLSLNPDAKSKSESDQQIVELCDTVVEAPSASIGDVAWAWYYRGLYHLREARSGNQLQHFWHSRDAMSKNDTNDTDRTPFTQQSSCIARARSCFDNALQRASSSSDILTRKILRCLALCTGPERGDMADSDSDPDSASYLILCSIGRLLRDQMRAALDDCSNNHAEVFRAFDDSFFEAKNRRKRFDAFLDMLAKHVPPNWRFVGIALCPTGETLMTRIRKERSAGTGRWRMVCKSHCIFPEKEAVMDERGGAYSYNKIVRPVDELIDESEQHLQQMATSSAADRLKQDSGKRAWWSERTELDEKMQSLMSDIDTYLFQQLDLASDEDASMDDLADQFSTTLNLSDSEDKRIELMKLTVPKLKERLAALDVPASKYRRLRKKEIIDMVVEAEGDAAVDSSVGSRKDGMKPVFLLVLDENLQRVPFEGTPTLLGKSVCRIPSLPHALMTLMERKSREIDPLNAKYILDPEANLLSTRRRLEPVIDGLVDRSSWDWSGAIGSKPSPEFVEDGLRRDDGLMLYIGHGGGEACFTKRQVEALIRDGNDATTQTTNSGRACHATVILMGCSSGRLTSINRRHARVFDELPLYYDPEGVALSYLLAGAPCVVGNLWDVTDHDIDRYTIKLLGDFLGDNQQRRSLAQCVAEARTACKMQYVVGCAPVCYGIPVIPRFTSNESR